jgi:hypothetical protein
MAVTSLAAQNKQREVETQQRLIELAKEVWKCFPTECDISSMGDMDNFWFDVKLPEKLFRPSLIDSLNVAFAEAIPTTTYASAMKYNRLDNGKDSISYTMTWDKLSTKDSRMEPIADHHFLPQKQYYTSHPAEAVFDNMNDSVFLWIALPHRKARQERYDISGFESMLDAVKKAYPNKHQKVKFPDDPTLKGNKYVITCNADSVFEVLSQYVLRHYWYEDSPMIAISYIKNGRSHTYNGQEMQLLLYDSEHICNDRYIEFVVCGDKLLLLDLKNMHDYSNEYQYYPPNTEHVPAYPPMDWIEMLEPELRQLDYERFLQRMNASMKKHEPIKQ